MHSRSHIQSELNELNSSLPFDVKEPVFDLPEGYFENFASGVLAEIKGEHAVSAADELTELSPLLAGMSKKMPFSIPGDFFESNRNLLASLADEEPKPDFLTTINRAMPYAVPVGYFEGLPEQVLSKVSTPQTDAKVVPMFSHKWVRYAAAAVVVGVMAVGSIFYFGSDPVDPVNEPQEWVARKLKNVSSSELDAFISTTDGTETVQTGTGKTEIRTMLNDVSDKELEAFLGSLPVSEEADPMIN